MSRGRSRIPSAPWADFVLVFAVAWGAVVAVVGPTALLDGTQEASPLQLAPVLAALLFHYQLINPLWPDAQPWDSWILGGVAAGAVWLHRDTMLRPGSGAMEVVPPEPPSPPSAGLPMGDDARRETLSGPGPV
jgi:hypothetical protein